MNNMLSLEFNVSVKQDASIISALSINKYTHVIEFSHSMQT